MNFFKLGALVAILLPTSVFAAPRDPAVFLAGNSLVVATSTVANVYAAGASVVVTDPVAADFSALGGSVIIAAPVAGDDLVAGGSVSSRASVSGDLRVAGGSIDISEPINGDLLALGYSVRDSGRAKGSVFVVAANATLIGGATGPVVVYGNNVMLAGDFANNVRVVAGGRLALGPDTHIHGTLSYEAPDLAIISPSAVVDGGTTYTSASYLPDVGTSRALAFLSLGLFIVARIIGALILAGLIAGLFPRFAEALTASVYAMRPRSVLLAFLLGFAIAIATPIVIILLLLTFVGIGLAALIITLYALVMLLAFVYAGIVTGSFLARQLVKRNQVLWYDGITGMAVLSLVTIIPYVGIPIALAFVLFFVGVLLRDFFHFAFPHEDR